MASMDDTGTSYRQAGTLKPGNVAKGPPPAIDAFINPSNDAPYPVMRPRIKRAVPSIPSKFETTLHVGQRERDAFGGRTNRFSPYENEMPGPGNYHKDRSFVRDQKTCGSVSKMGYGVGFVSKARRFQETDKKQIQSMLDPAPGQYVTNTQVWVRRTFSTAPVTANFTKPRKYRDDATIEAKPVPGPGAYQPKDPRSVTAPPMFKQARQSSTFESKTKRDSYITSHSVAPAPGYYNYDNSAFAKYKRKNKAKSRASAAYRGTDDRLGNLYPAAKRGVPGPGSYLQISSSLSAANAKTAGSNADEQPATGTFGSVNLDRFGRAVDRKTEDDTVPGPGTYAGNPSLFGRAAGAACVFSSTVSRLGVPSKQVKPPGPAFYKPRTTAKKSFLLNAARRWV